MKQLFILLTAIAGILTACSGNFKNKKYMKEGNEPLVRIETTSGDIIVKLYNETPKHRDNFIKLVKEGAYDKTLFHRVIKDFMIQAGDPKSKNATANTLLGDASNEHKIPAEINKNLFHKRGALAAARQNDNINPQRASSGYQFYIVTGKTFSEPQLISLENEMESTRLTAVFDTLARKHMKEIYQMRKANDQKGLLALQDTLEAQARKQLKEEGGTKFSEAQKQAYTTIGGAPHLDGSYTVFGEVVDGMDTVDKINTAKTGRADRPEEDIRIVKATVIKE